MISVRRQVLLGQGIRALILIAIGLINVYFATNKAVNYVLGAIAVVFFVFDYFQSGMNTPKKNSSKQPR